MVLEHSHSSAGTRPHNLPTETIYLVTEYNEAQVLYPTAQKEFTKKEEVVLLTTTTTTTTTRLSYPVPNSVSWF